MNYPKEFERLTKELAESQAEREKWREKYTQLEVSRALCCFEMEKERGELKFLNSTAGLTINSMLDDQEATEAKLAIAVEALKAIRAGVEPLPCTFASQALAKIGDT